MRIRIRISILILYCRHRRVVEIVIAITILAIDIIYFNGVIVVVAGAVVDCVGTAVAAFVA